MSGFKKLTYSPFLLPSLESLWQSRASSTVSKSTHLRRLRRFRLWRMHHWMVCIRGRPPGENSVWQPVVTSSAASTSPGSIGRLPLRLRTSQRSILSENTCRKSRRRPSSKRRKLPSKSQRPISSQLRLMTTPLHSW